MVSWFEILWLWDPGFAICPRDARPNRSTPDLSCSLELDAGIRGGRSRPCVLSAHRFSADSVQFDRPALSRCVPMGPVLCQERKRDARPNRSTPDLRRPCEEDAGFRVCRPRRCLLSAHGFSVDPVRVDAGRLARPRPCARSVVRLSRDFGAKIYQKSSHDDPAEASGPARG